MRRLRPEVLVLDVTLPDVSGVEIARQVRALYPEVRILVLDGRDEPDAFEALVQLGVRGYMPKTATGDEVVAAVRVIAGGGTHLESQASAEPARTGGAPLTGREREILELLAVGRRYGEIAAMLRLSVNTVETHIRHLYTKLGVDSRTEAISTAVRLDLVRLGPGV
jgi:DNA-binding NarL/FixJ family response regulator